MAMLYLESTSTDPFYNLALEQFVFDALPRSNEYFMLWQNDNAIIIGKHQNTIEEINAPYVREKGIRVARRLSGGGAVYHDLGNLNYTFIKDSGAEEQLDLASFCIPVIHTMSHLGIKAELSGRNDLTIDGKKFSGNAQYLREKRVMHHGTLMFRSDLSVLTEALNVSPDKIESKGIKSIRSRVTNICEHLKEPMTMEEFKAVLRHNMAEENQMQPYALTDRDLAAVRKLRDERYAAWEWNYGSSPAYSIRKERRIEGCGKLQIYLEVEKGLITGFATRGDYFGADDASDVERALLGTKANEQALRAALFHLDIGRYYKNLTAEQLIQIILQ